MSFVCYEDAETANGPVVKLFSVGIYIMFLLRQPSVHIIMSVDLSAASWTLSTVMVYWYYFVHVSTYTFWSTVWCFVDPVSSFCKQWRLFTALTAKPYIRNSEWSGRQTLFDRNICNILTSTTVPTYNYE